MHIDNGKLELIPNGKDYYDFIRMLRTDPDIISGFISQKPISEEQQQRYMSVHAADYYICLYDSAPIGFIGVADGDLRLAVRTEYQRQGVASFMLAEICKLGVRFTVRVREDNQASLAFFEKNGFTRDGIDKDDCVLMKRGKGIPFNKPYLSGNEIEYIKRALGSGKISGNGTFTKRCHAFFEQRYAFKKCLLTTSCTDALEMAAILAGIKPGDEVIVPSFTFVSSAVAFVRQGARIVFADSCVDNPNMDVAGLERLVTPRTRAIVAVHYAGVACEMDAILDFANRHGLIVVEDAAQSIDSFYKGKPLGSMGHFGCFSFHETKNVISGEGGMLVINDEEYARRAEIVWEKGTNRVEFSRGTIDKYSWVDIGSSFLPSEITAAFLYAQLENLDRIQEKRKALWLKYYGLLGPHASRGKFALPSIPEHCTNSAHMFYIVCDSHESRAELIRLFKERDILAVTHYQSLHRSEYYRSSHDGRTLPNADKFTERLLRLPLFYELSEAEVELICDIVIKATT